MPSSPFRLPARALLSLCGIGFLPMSPGTWGSLVALAVILSLHHALPDVLGFAALAALFLGAWALGTAAMRFVEPPYDRRFIVLDELLGMCVACAPLFLADRGVAVQMAAAAFVFFRVFDIAKPFGIRRIDRSGTPASVFLDDILAGAYAAVGTLAFWVMAGA